MRPVRFIHTSDVHLDTSFSGAGLPPRLGDRKREAIRGTFRSILEEAARISADFVLISGDLFEHDRVSSDTVEFLKQQFAALGGVKVFITPGNHDPYLDGSPYRNENWPPQVHIFRDERFESVELADFDVRITGFAYNRTLVQERPFAALQPLPADRVNIVMAHASEAARIPPGKTAHAPFSIDEIAGKNVGYCALGHYHQQRAIENAGVGTQVWYPGIPEGRAWDEEQGCGFLCCEIARDGTISVERRQCERYPFRTISVNCDGFATREQIVDAVVQNRGTRYDSSTVMRVRLEGAVDPRLGLSLNELDERLAGEALHIVWEDRTQPAVDFEAIAGERTLKGQFARTMNEQLAAASDEDREVIERARLYGMQALLDREVRLR
jgi:DNA repair protein SbcD/Mre11